MMATLFVILHAIFCMIKDAFIFIGRAISRLFGGHKNGSQANKKTDNKKNEDADVDELIFYDIMDDD